MIVRQGSRSGWNCVHVTAAVAMLVVFFGIALSVEAATSHPYDSHVRKTVTVGRVRYDIDLVKINLNNPKLKIRTYTGTTGSICYNVSCRTRSLKAYLDQGKGFAAINGSYFCPSDYRTCGPAGNYYWTVFNARNKTYVNAAQNRFNHRGAMLTFDANRKFRFYADTDTYPYLPRLHGPAVIDPAASILTAAISNGPTFIDRGKYVLSGWRMDQLDTKQRTAKMYRSGIGIRGTVVYLVVARNATVPDLGRIMQSMKLDYAMNLDGGGSTALWYRGAYKVGPGRNLPNAIVFSER